jgi:carbonic anhydrase
MPIIGLQQSPIRIEKDKTYKVDFGPDFMQVGYSGPLPGKYQGDNFVFDNPRDSKGKTIRFGDNTWVIRKIHIHSPAEHVLDDNEPATYECHLVHSGENDPHLNQAKLVIGAFFHVDKKAFSRPTIRALNRKLRDAREGGETADAQGDRVHPHPVDPTEFLPDLRKRVQWYFYQGSLTSEPFSEDVSWYVMPAETGILPGEIDEIGRFARQEARPVHALDRRIILRNFK